MASNYCEKNTFEAEWFDAVASLLKKFYLYYYPSDNTIEIYDIKNKKTFLRRTKCEGIKAEDLYPGALVKIFSRSIKIINFADTATKNKLANTMQRTCGVLKPDVIDKMGEILKMIAKNNFHIANMKMVKLTREEAQSFYLKHREESQFPFMLNYITSGVVLALELIGEKVIDRWRQLIGPENFSEARQKTPSTIRACYGKDSLSNGVHGSDSVQDAIEELDVFFPDKKVKRKVPQNTATFKNCTCCIIKPHAVQAQIIGDIVDDIQKTGYTISAVQQFHIDSINVEEFLEVYKGVLPEYGAMVTELQSGPCIAMEITHADKDKDVPTEFRKLCGPMDPPTFRQKCPSVPEYSICKLFEKCGKVVTLEIARQLRPNTLRARYGKNKVQNAVHCSDLPEDGLLEVEYFFKILADT